MSDDDDQAQATESQGDLPLILPTVSAADPNTTKEQRRTQQLERREADQFWRAILANKVGRREIWRLLQGGHAFDERFACGPNGFPQPEATWLHAGESSSWHRFYLALAARDREGVLVMHDEHDSRFESFRNATRASQSKRQRKR